MPNPTDPSTASAAELALWIRQRKLSSLEVIDAAIARIEARNPDVNAFVYTDFDAARAAARKADEAVASGARLGPLHGVPVSIKDLFNVRGMPTQGGTRAPLHELSDAEARDAEAFARERNRQTDAAEVKRRRDEKREELLRRAEHLASDAFDRTRDVGGEVVRRSLDAGREALEKLPGIGSWQLPRPGRKSREDEPREVRKAEARDLRHEPPLPEE